MIIDTMHQAEHKGIPFGKPQKIKPEKMQALSAICDHLTWRLVKDES